MLCDDAEALIKDEEAFKGSQIAPLRPRGDAAGEVDMRQLRKDLQTLQKAVALRQLALEARLPEPETTFRAGHLRALTYFVGQPPSHPWQEEWPALRQEHHGLTSLGSLGSPSPAPVESIVEMTQRFQNAISKLEANRWTKDHALAYSLLSACRNALGRALRDKDRCYAASTYALSEALWRAPTRNKADIPDMYFHRQGPYSLTEAEPAWGNLERKDATGFQGLISTAMTRVLRRCGVCPGGHWRPLAATEGH